MERPIMDLIERPGSENLYWALAELPRPMISLRRCLTYERAATSAFLSYLLDVDARRFDEGKWDKLT